MKTNFGSLLRGALTLIGLAVCGASLSQAAAPVSPVGTWDFLVSGTHGQKGMAFLTFSDNGSNRTFSGFELLVSSPSSFGEIEDSRNAGLDVTRKGFEAGPSETNGALTTLVGFSSVSGPWSYDSKGRVVGYFTQPVNAGGQVTNYTSVCVSNQFVFTTNSLVFVTNLSFCFSTATFSTNVVWTDPTNASTTFTFNNTNFTVSLSTVETVNQVSFSGKVVPGKRFTLKGSTSFGNSTFRGVPYTSNLKDLSGSWQALRKEGGQDFFETLDMTSFGTGHPPGDLFQTNVIPENITNFPNIYYSTNNLGAGYTNATIAALSVQKKIGFVFSTDSGDLRASIGPFSSTKNGTKGDTKGIELPSTPFKFKAVLVP